MLLDHLDGILNYCRVPVRFGVVEAINGNIKALLRRGRGYTNLRYLLGCRRFARLLRWRRGTLRSFEQRQRRISRIICFLPGEIALLRQ
jgi:hypothetical protein